MGARTRAPTVRGSLLARSKDQTSVNLCLGTGSQKPAIFENSNDRTIVCICGQLLVFISHKASKASVAFM